MRTPGVPCALAVTVLGAIVALTATSCTSEPTAASASEDARKPSESPSSPGNIPVHLWNQAVPDPLRPLGLAGMGTPTPPLIATSYEEGTDRIGDWRLIDINEDRTELVIQYSQGGPCGTGKGILRAETSTAVALVPIYQKGPATPCDSVLYTPVGTVNLDKPLGDRDLLHLPGDGTMQSPTTAPSR